MSSHYKDDDARPGNHEHGGRAGGTGLGSSGSFTTALLKALYIHHRRHIDMAALAELACHIEIDTLEEPIGKQDQYIAAFGGLTAFTFERNGTVGVETLEISDETHEDLEENLVMFFTGRLRSASAILQEQDQKSRGADPAMIANLHRVKELGYRTRDAFLKVIFADGARSCGNIGRLKRSAPTACQIRKSMNITILRCAMGLLAASSLGRAAAASSYFTRRTPAAFVEP